MVLSEILSSLAANHPALVVFLLGALCAGVVALVLEMKRRTRAKAQLRRTHEQELTRSLNALHFANSVMESKLSAASLLDEAADTLANRSQNGDRLAEKKLAELNQTRLECNLALKQLERTRDQLEAGSLSLGELGTVEVSFQGCLEYFREKFPVL